MAKVTINGEVLEWDASRKPMSEALALEKVTGWRWGEFEEELAAGSARALCAFIWLVWRRDGREVEFADIESGAVDIDLDKCDFGKPEEEGEPDPTVPAKAASPTTASATSPRSHRSTSGPGRSGG